MSCELIRVFMKNWNCKFTLKCADEFFSVFNINLKDQWTDMSIE